MPEGIERHEIEMHRNDEEVLTVLFGPKLSQAQGGGRQLNSGLVRRVDALEHNKKTARLAIGDKVTIGLIILVVESIRLFL